MFGCRILDPDGSFIHWPDINVHLDWNQFLQAVEPAELHKAQQRSTGFNRRYGAAIRKLRAQAGIPQAKVEGITERQLRRIEQGDNERTARPGEGSTVKDITDAVMYLTDAATVTGDTLYVDGGSHFGRW